MRRFEKGDAHLSIRVPYINFVALLFHGLNDESKADGLFYFFSTVYISRHGLFLSCGGVACGWDDAELSIAC